MMTRAGVIIAAVFWPQHLFSRLYDVAPYQQHLRDWIAEHGFDPAAELAEIGCGPGRFAIDLTGAGYRVTGVDSSARMIRAARRNGLAHARSVVANAENLLFEDASFDATICASLINVVAEPLKLLTEMRRVTRPGGVVSCLFPGPTLQESDPTISSGLGYLDRELLKAWAGLSRKLAAETVCNWMSDVGLETIECRSFWDGRTHAVSGRV